MSEGSETSEETMGRRTKGIRDDQLYLRPSPEMLFFHFCDSSISMTIIQSLMCRISLVSFPEKAYLGEERTPVIKNVKLL